MSTDEIIVNPMDLVLKHDDIRNLRQSIKLLNYRGRIILELRFGLVDGRIRSLRECSQILGIHSETVRLHQKGALRKLHELMTLE